MLWFLAALYRQIDAARCFAAHTLHFLWTRLAVESPTGESESDRITENGTRVL